MSLKNESRRCKLCNSEAVSYLCDTFNGHSETNHISHFRCSDCGLVFVGNRFSESELAKAYSTLDSSSYYEEIECELLKKMESACVHLSELVDKKAKIIDIGTGNGLFLEVLHQVGFENLYAHEIAGEDLSRIKDITKDIYQDFDYNSIPSDFFDVVTLLDVVEHVIDPHYLLRTCERILKPGGIVYFHTPVVTKTDRLMHLMQKIPIASKVGCLWQAARTSIFHLQNYTQKSLQLLLKESGFKDIEIEIKNELSWPLSLYIRVYLLDKLGLPRFLVPVFYPALYPMLATNLFNANKSIVSARKALL